MKNNIHTRKNTIQCLPCTLFLQLQQEFFGDVFLFSLRHLQLQGFHLYRLWAFVLYYPQQCFFFFLLIKDKSLLKIHLRDIWMFIGTGVISLTFFSLCYFTTILEIGTSVAVILLYISPIFVLLLSVLLFKEKINAVKITALIMTFIGCILVAGIAGGEAITLKGFLIGLCAGFSYALYSIFNRFALKKYNSFTITFYTFVFSGLSLLPFIHPLEVSSKLNSKVWIFAIGIAFFCSIVIIIKSYIAEYVLYFFRRISHYNRLANNIQHW